MRPKRVSARQERRTSPGRWARTASSSASDGSGSITSPTDSIPNSAQHRHRHLDPGPRGFADLVGVDQLADRRLVLRRRDDDAGDLLLALAHGLQQLAAAGDLVEEDQQRLALLDPLGRS